MKSNLVTTFVQSRGENSLVDLMAPSIDLKSIEATVNI